MIYNILPKWKCVVFTKNVLPFLVQQYYHLRGAPKGKRNALLTELVKQKRVTFKASGNFGESCIGGNLHRYIAFRKKLCTRQDEKMFQIIIWASQGAREHETHFGLGANGF